MKRQREEDTDIEAKGGVEEVEAPLKVQRHDSERIRCPFLDTINRQLLDFDSEMVCSVTLSNRNVYACLVCGRYFQGRGQHTPAHTHSVSNSHHVFINLSTSKIYCLPDNYEVVDESLRDILLALNPVYAREEISNIDKQSSLSRDIHGISYLPGFIGMNSHRTGTYVSSLLHALFHVTPLRNFFLSLSNESETWQKIRCDVTKSFGKLVRKYWSSHSFKSTLSPHEFIHHVSIHSKKRFEIGKVSDINSFCSYLLNTLHKGLRGTRWSGGNASSSASRGKKDSIVSDVFGGQVEVNVKERKEVDLKEMRKVEEEEEGGNVDYVWEERDEETNFLMLTLDIPPAPLFKDTEGGVIIPTISLFSLLDKYDGIKENNSLVGSIQFRKRYCVTSLPPYVVFSLPRFKSNTYFIEKNLTIVTFPLSHLDLSSIYFGEEEDISLPFEDNTTSQLLSFLRKYQIPHEGIVERGELLTLCSEHQHLLEDKLKYDLVSSICHESPSQEDLNPLEFGRYKVHLIHEQSRQYFEICDLEVKDIYPQEISQSESSLMIFRRRNS